jgi:hypothetical protein
VHCLTAVGRSSGAGVALRPRPSCFFPSGEFRYGNIDPPRNGRQPRRVFRTLPLLRRGQLILAGLAAVWLLPHTQQFTRACEPAIGEVGPTSQWISWLKWQPLEWWSRAALGAVFAWIILAMSSGNPSEFLHYQF